jgi:mediator of RNA polymerase II transcription subunit 11
MHHVSPKKTSEENATVSFNKSSTDFLQLMKEIHGELATHIHLVSDYRVYGRSTYGIEKELSLCRERAKIIFDQLKGISNYLDENCVPGEDASHAQECVALK